MWAVLDPAAVQWERMKLQCSVCLCASCFVLIVITHWPIYDPHTIFRVTSLHTQQHKRYGLYALSVML